MFVFSHTKARDLGTIWICWSPGHLTGKHIAVWNCPGHDGKTRDGAQEKEVGAPSPWSLARSLATLRVHASSGGGLPGAAEVLAR